MRSGLGPVAVATGDRSDISLEAERKKHRLVLQELGLSLVRNHVLRKLREQKYNLQYLKNFDSSFLQGS